MDEVSDESLTEPSEKSEEISEETDETPEGVASEEIEETENSAGDSISEEDSIEEDVLEAGMTVKSIPNDEYVNSQWYLGSGYGIDAFNAWDQMTNNTPAIVAVVDSGCQLDHPDINIQEDKCVTYNNGTKSSFTNGDNSYDDNGHGTHVCGIIAAETNNSTGIAGIANGKVQLIVIDVMQPSGSISTQDIVLAIDYATNQGAKVINLSIGGLYKDFILDNAVNTAYNNGALCVCAAGNESSALYTSPSDAGGAIGVMSHDSDGNMLTSSNFGVNKDVSAPGRTIYSTYKDSTYKNMSGTSMATPIVTATAALLLAQDSSLTPRELKNLIYSSSNDFTRDFGFGRINANTAMSNLKNRKSAEKIFLNADTLSLYKGESFDLEYAVYPGGAYKSSVSVASSNTSIATVSGNTVTAVAPGSCNITFTSGSAQASCTVTVKSIPYQDFTRPYTVNGYLATSDPRISVKRNNTLFESYMDGYKTQMNSGEVLSVTLQSNEMIPALRILDANENVLSSKYGSRSTRTISLSYTATTTGTYKIQVLAYPDGEESTSRLYTLDVAHEHTLQKVAGKDATCTTDGWETYYTCSCGKMFSDAAGTNVITSVPVIKASHSWGSDSFTWSGTSVTAKRICQRDSSHVEQETVTATSQVINEPTCAATGLTRYTAKFTNFATQTKDVTTDKTAHIWGSPSYTWSSNYSSATASRTCTLGHTDSETVATTSQVITAPTCASTGLTRYTAKFTNFATQTKDVTTSKTAHNWGTPSFTWTNNNSSVTASHTCSLGHTETETVAATSQVITAPTCASTGTTRYTAKFQNFATQTKDVTTDKTAHVWGEPTYTWSSDKSSVTASRTCTKGHVEKETVSTTRTVSGNYYVYTATFTNTAFKKQTTTVPISQNWSTPVYTWTQDYSSVTATRTESNTGAKETETVKTTSQVIKQATCSQSGTMQYTATFKNTAFTKQTKTVSISIISHNWNEPTYTWASNNSSVTAKRTCKGNSSHVQTETVRTTSKVTKQPTIYAKGETTYTATFSNPSFKTQSKTVANINQLVVLPSVKISKLTKAKKAFTVKWKAVSKANKKKITGIEIQYSLNSNFATATTRRVSKSKTSLKVTRLMSKRTYYVRIRTYSSKGHSTWSPIKKIKVK